MLVLTYRCRSAVIHLEYKSFNYLPSSRSEHSTHDQLSTSPFGQPVCGVSNELARLGVSLFPCETSFGPPLLVLAITSDEEETPCR